MIGTTLNDIRGHIEELASDTGEYSLVCARYGEPPVPATALRFESRATARAAARATEQYRAALRRYDPQLPYYDVIVCQATGTAAQTSGIVRATFGGSDSDDRPCPEPAVDATASKRQALVEFCHRVAAAVFETLSDRKYEAIESAIMDAYFEFAETLTNPDDLCLCLLERIAWELDQQLTPDEQVAVIDGAASRLTPCESAADPLSASLGLLEERGLLGGFTQSPCSIDLDGGTRSVTVRISEYALSPQAGRLPVLPLVLDCSRRQPDWFPAALRVDDAGEDWRLTLDLTSDAEPTGLASAPIHSEV